MPPTFLLPFERTTFLITVKPNNHKTEKVELAKLLLSIKYAS